MDAAGTITTTGADILAQRLYAAGVRHAFGIPGGEVLALIEALDRAGIAFHLTRHENAAGFMAEGAWHATGAPAVLVATVGPGIANAFNVIANAEQDRVPLIAISGMIDRAEAASYTHQVFDHGAVMRQVCKASFELVPGAVDTLADKAVRLALAPRKGPVHLDLPIRVATGAEAPTGRPVPGQAPLGAPAGEMLAAMTARWQAAQRPMIMAGLDVLEEPGGPDALRAFVERHQVPLVTTYKAKGILPEDHPLSLGGHGLSPKADKIVLEAFGAADLILSLGYDPIEMRTGWRDPWDPAKVIEIAHAPNTHDMHAAELSCLGSVSGLLAALDAAAPAPRDPTWAAPIRSDLLAAVAPGADWGPDRAMTEILAALPAGAVTTVDSGAHRILLSQHFFCDQPRMLMQSTGLCTMGCALPLAVGHALAAPARPAVAFMGDGCAEMVLGEFATLRDLSAAARAGGPALGPVIVVVFVDASLALIEMKQRRDQRPNAGVDFGAATDFAALAGLFGGHAERITAAGEAAPAMARALSATAEGRFAVIEVALPRRAYDGLL
ncbi:MAG: thiamine pyrophosphate-binding protein [Pseudomonadota bacterium]